MPISIKNIIAAAIAAICLTSCHTPPQTELSQSQAARLSGNYVLDPQHASIIWSLSHAGLSNYQARFDDIRGELDFNANDPTKSRIEIIIDPKSVNTGLPDFDKTISMTAPYFNAEKFPEIRFRSTEIVLTGDNKGIVTGDLSFRGVTKPVSLNVTYNGAGKSFGHPGQTLGFSANGKFDRTEFGLTHLTNFGIGKEVSLRIEVEFNEK